MLYVNQIGVDNTERFGVSGADSKQNGDKEQSADIASSRWREIFQICDRFQLSAFRMKTDGLKTWKQQGKHFGCKRNVPGNA